MPKTISHETGKGMDSIAYFISNTGVIAAAYLQSVFKPSGACTLMPAAVHPKSTESSNASRFNDPDPLKGKVIETPQHFYNMVNRP